ncbi:MAG: hypothetical protein LKE37_04880 [Atopobiaceae bacterium]|nr:hypothetical protein [Atopobiaceae bacterium]
MELCRGRASGSTTAWNPRGRTASIVESSTTTAKERGWRWATPEGISMRMGPSWGTLRPIEVLKAANGDEARGAGIVRGLVACLRGEAVRLRPEVVHAEAEVLAKGLHVAAAHVADGPGLPLVDRLAGHPDDVGKLLLGDSAVQQPERMDVLTYNAHRTLPDKCL